MSYYYDVSITCGCLECGRLTTFDADTINDTIGDDYPQTCESCIEKLYSAKAIRNKKLEKILKPWWQFWK